MTTEGTLTCAVELLHQAAAIRELGLPRGKPVVYWRAREDINICSANCYYTQLMCGDAELAEVEYIHGSQFMAISCLWCDLELEVALAKELLQGLCLVCAGQPLPDVDSPFKLSK